MLELMGIFYLAYSTYRITKVVSVARAILWFIATLLFYFMFVYGLTFVVTVVLAVLQVPNVQITSIIVVIVLVLGAISIIYFIQDHLEEKIRIDLKSRRDSVAIHEQHAQLSPYVGEYVSLNYDNDSSTITRARSALPNGASLMLKHDNSESFFQNEIIVAGAEFRAVHSTTKYNYTLFGSISNDNILVRCDVLNNENGDRTEISDTLTQAVRGLSE